MLRASWSHWLSGKSNKSGRRQALRGGVRCPRLQIERLEDRTLLSTWAPTVLEAGSGDQVTFEQRSEGGHPSYLYGDHSHETEGGSHGITTVIKVAHLSTSTASYDPAVSGPITSFDLGFDFKNADGQPVQVGFLVRQNNIYYAGGGSAFVSQPWQHLARSLSAGDFTRVSGVDHPNFGANGGSIQFGVFISTTGAPTFHQGRCISWDAEVRPPRCEEYADPTWTPWGAAYGLDNFSEVDHPVAQSATHFSVVPSTLNPVAGAAFTAIVTALDANNNRDYRYHGTVRFASTDTTATLPLNYTVTTGSGADNGAHVFNGLVLRKSGSQTITVTDTVYPTIYGFVIVSARPGMAATLELSVPSPMQAGMAGSVRVNALDSFRNLATGYQGTVQITTSDAMGTRPSAHTFTAGDGGTYIWSNGLTLFTAGPQTVTATDPALPPPVVVSVLVTPGPAVRFLVLGIPAQLVAGTPVNNVTAVAEDLYDNTVTGYRGRVTWSSGDGQATLPESDTFQDYDEGSHRFRNPLILRTTERQTITVTDTVAQTLRGSVPVTVLPAAASTLAVSCNPSSLTAGDSTTCTVTARDPFHNIATGYRGIIRFSSSDGQATFPTGIYPFTAADNGVHIFPNVVLRTAGPQTVTATDLVTSSITGSASVTVAPAVARTLEVVLPLTVSPNAPGPVTVRARDAYRNIASGYRGTVRITSSDEAAVLPGDAAFSDTDGGEHLFTIQFRAAGTQLVTATDTSDSSISGTGTTTVLGLFATATNYAVGSSPLAVAMGDFNGDGYPDLAIVNSGSDTVSVLLGNGDGTFGPALSYDAGHLPRSLLVGDFRGDGKLDLVVANASGVSILLGNGDGTFQPPVNLAVGGTPAFLAVGDFNGDGNPDLAVAVGTGFALLLGNGDGTFQNPVSFSLGFNVTARSLAAGDFTGDGKLSLAVAYTYSVGSVQSGAVALLRGNGDGTFGYVATYGLPGSPDSLTVADLDGDGKLDLLVTTNDTSGPVPHGAVSVLLGNGDGSVQEARSYDVGSAVYGVAVGDFNGDGIPDVAVANGSGVVVLVGTGDGTFQPGVIHRAGSFPRSVVAGDWNRDGGIDLAVANTDSANVSVLLNQSGSGLGPRGAPPSGPERRLVDHAALLELPCSLLSGWEGDSREPAWESNREVFGGYKSLPSAGFAPDENKAESASVPGGYRSPGARWTIGSNRTTPLTRETDPLSESPFEDLPDQQ